MKILSNIVYWIVRGLTKVVTKVVFPAKVTGKEHLKSKEPYLLCANHLSMMDPVILVGAVLHRKAFFMGKAELYKSKLGNWFFRSLLSFPVVRGTADMTAIRSSIDVLKDGKVMIIFPEGTRNVEKDGQIQELFNGVAMIALRAECNIVPCYIDSVGGYKFWKKFNVRVGAPIDIKQYTENGFKKENLSKIMKDLKNHLEDLKMY